MIEDLDLFIMCCDDGYDPLDYDVYPVPPERDYSYDPELSGRGYLEN